MKFIKKILQRLADRIAKKLVEIDRKLDAAHLKDQCRQHQAPAPAPAKTPPLRGHQLTEEG